MATRVELNGKSYLVETDARGTHHVQVRAVVGRGVMDWKRVPDTAKHVRAAAIAAAQNLDAACLAALGPCGK